MFLANGATDGGGASGLTLLILALPILLLVYLMFSQRRRAKQLGDAQQALQAGQEVMTTSGIHGVIAGLEHDVVHLTVADGVTMRVDRRAIVPLSMAPGARENRGRSGGATPPRGAEDEGPRG